MTLDSTRWKKYRLSVPMGAHLLAAAYLTVVSAVVVIVEAHFGVRLETVWGLQFRNPVVYPLAFWSATFLYGYWSGRRTGLAPREWVGRAILLGAWVHVNLLVITMSHETDLLALLTSTSFTRYIFGVVGAVAIGSCVLSAVCCAAIWRGWRDDFWLPLVYLPLAHIWLQRSLGSLLVLVEVGLVVSAVLIADRNIYTRCVESARRWWPRVANEATIILGIYLLAFAFRFVAAQRLSGMGIQTIMTNTDDPDQYHRAALAILNGEWIPRYTSVGYDMLLAGLYWLTDVDLARVLVLQATLTATVPVAVYLVGRQLFGRAAGVTAAVIAALSQLLIFNSVNLTREVAGSLFVPWSMVLLLPVLAHAHEKKGLWLAVPAGTVFGFLIAYDPTFLIVSVCVSAGFMACTRFTILQRVTRVAVFLAVVALCGMGIIRFASGDWTVLAREDQNMATSVSMDFNRYASLLNQRRINVFAFPRESARNFLADPFQNSTLIAQKLWLDVRRFLFEGNAGRFDPIVLIYGSFLAASLDFYGYLFGLLGAAVGLRGILGRPTRLDRAALFVFILSYAAVYIVLFFGMTRFRAPIQPLLLVLVGAGMVATVRFAVSRAFPLRASLPAVIPQ